MELGVLRAELDVARDGDDVLFPVTDSCGPRIATQPWEFATRTARPKSYTELLHWSAEELALAPRAFEQLGDIIVVKVPPELSAKTEELGAALQKFHGARAVFHDRGVKGEFRTRDLQRIAGSGSSLTRVAENGVQMWVDLAHAYFSPRLATERTRVAALVQPGERFIDMFAGVAPMSIQAAKRGARVDAIDLNPDAVALAQRNLRDCGVANLVRMHAGDARTATRGLGPADRVVMNLPHGARQFLDVAANVLAPRGTLHYHEILRTELAEDRGRELEQDLGSRGWPCRLSGMRVVRNYSPTEGHYVYDLVGTGADRAGGARMGQG